MIKKKWNPFLAELKRKIICYQNQSEIILEDRSSGDGGYPAIWLEHGEMEGIKSSAAWFPIRSIWAIYFLIFFSLWYTLLFRTVKVGQVGGSRRNFICPVYCILDTLKRNIKYCESKAGQMWGQVLRGTWWGREEKLEEQWFLTPGVYCIHL